jgi:hypothetical protein
MSLRQICKKAKDKVLDCFVANAPGNDGFTGFHCPRNVIASEAKHWIASRSLSSGAHSRDPVARNDEQN